MSTDLDLPMTGASRLADLPAIDLPTLIARGNLQDRVDRKYLLPTDELPAIVSAIGFPAQVLQIGSSRHFGYRSVYFDTPGLACYLMAARRRPRRFKVRTRTYLDSGECWLEAKTRDARGRSVKERLAHDGADSLNGQARQFLHHALPHLPGEPCDLSPRLTTYYQRTTLFLPAEGVRVTIDTDLVAIDSAGRAMRLPRQMIIETKSPGSACAMDRLLWRMGRRPIPISKYATSLAALNPALPANKWTPALRRLDAVTL